ncbi:MAG: c-type cytochrome [Granulosicoccus sp.]|nr:c-type cytochrome [Granulosicoccus sp.]
MSVATDSGMVKTMGIVLGALIVFALICGVAARMLSAGSEDPNDPMVRNALMNRIEPVASVRTSADDLPAATEVAMTAAATGEPRSAEELINGACAACHSAGLEGVPQLGDDAAWAERRESGLDALVASVINGKGTMPARGGSNYSDEEIRIAVQQMAMFEADEAAPATNESAQAPAAEASEDTQVASVETTDVVAAAAVGTAPDGLTDNIKTQVNGVCAGCHIAGLANAPKIGDKAAWQKRADKGLDALTQSVINGLNVMPARGGSTLADDEIPIAIQYLMSK